MHLVRAARDGIERTRPASRLHLHLRQSGRCHGSALPDHARRSSAPPRCCTSADLRPPLLGILEPDGGSLHDAANATMQALTVACEHERHRSAQVSCGARFWLTDACPRFSTVAHKGASEPSSTGRLSCNRGMYLEEVPARFGREQGAVVAGCAPDGVNGSCGLPSELRPEIQERLSIRGRSGACFCRRPKARRQSAPLEV